MIKNQTLKNSIKIFETKSERLISWIQLIFISLFAMVYFIAPKGFIDSEWEPVPILLTIYLPFVLIRLFLSYRIYLPKYYLIFTAIFDPIWLSVLIYSFHIQYMQPEGFSLKVPSFIYFFIFISLRSIRYEASYVIISGATAALCWIALLTNTIYQGNTPQTHHFVEYILANSYLVGAEIDKILVIMTVTIILGIGVHRSRKLLVESVREAKAHQDLSRFFSPEVEKAILKSEDKILPGLGSKKHALILMTDLRGFTTLSSKLDPDEVMNILAEYQEYVTKPILALGGSIDKFMGDGVLAHFGATSTSESFARDGLEAMFTILDSIDAWNKKRETNQKEIIEVGVSCTSGSVIFGAVGHKDRLEFTVIGEPVNSAAKLEKHTKTIQSRAVTTKATYDLAIHQGFSPKGDFKELKNQRVDGMPNLIDLVVCHSSLDLESAKKKTA